MPNTRIPSPHIVSEEESKSYFSDIPNETVSKYENGFMDSLLGFIKGDDALSHFHIRLICECENIIKVIDMVSKTEMLELEEIIENLSNAKNLELASQYDTEFHRRLFAITGEIEFFRWWRMQSESLHNFLINLWKTIGYKTTHYNELVLLHNKIFQAIERKDKEEAVKAMQKHFAIVLFQLLGTMYQEPADSCQVM